MRHIINYNRLSTLNYNRFQSQIIVQEHFLTIANNSMSMTLILHPLSLINVSVLIVHLSPTCTTVLTPDPLINSWFTVDVCPIPLKQNKVMQTSSDVCTWYQIPYIHAFVHFSIHHSTSLHTPLFLGAACCRYHIHQVSRVSTLHCKRHQIYSKSESPSLEKVQHLFRGREDKVWWGEGRCVLLLTMLLVVQPLSSIFVSTGEENGELQETLLWLDIHQCGGCLLFLRSCLFHPQPATVMTV